MTEQAPEPEVPALTVYAESASAGAGASGDAGPQPGDEELTDDGLD
jgi:hypothetical protein